MAKNAAAVALGRLGGQAKVAKGFATLGEEERAEAARKGALARWGRKKKAGKGAGVKKAG